MLDREFFFVLSDDETESKAVSQSTVARYQILMVITGNTCGRITTADYNVEFINL